MNSANPILTTKFRQSLQDTVNEICDELHLAKQWQKPAYLMAVNSMPNTKEQAISLIAAELIGNGISVYPIDAAKVTLADFTRIVLTGTEPENKVYLIDNLDFSHEFSESDSWQMFYHQRDSFDARQLKAIFWLSEKQLVQLAVNFPSYWEDRYRVFDLALDQDEKDSPINIDQPSSNNTLSAQLQTDAQENLRMGILNWRNGEADKAQPYLQNAVDLAEVLGDYALQAECQKALALALTSMGSLTEAIEIYEKTYPLLSDENFPWNNLGNLYLRTNNKPKAMQAFQFALAKNRKDVVAWVGMAEVYEKMDLHQEAINAYHAALKIVPDFPQALLNVGGVLEKINRFDKAAHAYQLLLGKDKKHLQAWLQLANLQFKQGGQKQAIETIKSALEYLPGKFELWMALGEFAEQHSPALASEAYRKALSLNPRSGHAYYCLAKTHESLGNITDAINCYEIGINFMEDDEQRTLAWTALISLLDIETPHTENKPVMEVSTKSNISNHEQSPIKTRIIASEKQPRPEEHSVELLPEKDIPQEKTHPQEMDELDCHSPLPIGFPAKIATHQPGKQDEAAEAIFSDAPAWILNNQTLKHEIHMLKQTHCALGTRHEQLQLLADARHEQTVEDIWQPHRKQRTTARKSEKFAFFPGQQNANISQQLAEMTGLRLKDFEQSDEKSAQSWIRQGKHLQKRGLHQDALAAFDSAINASPNNSAAYLGMGITYFFQNKYEKALEVFEKCAQLSRDINEKALAYNYIGDTYRRLQNTEKALQAYAKVSEIKGPNSSLKQRAQRVLVFGNC